MTMPCPSDPSGPGSRCMPPQLGQTNGTATMFGSPPRAPPAPGRRVDPAPGPTETARASAAATRACGCPVKAPPCNAGLLRSAASATHPLNPQLVAHIRFHQQHTWACSSGGETHGLPTLRQQQSR